MNDNQDTLEIGNKSNTSLSQLVLEILQLCPAGISEYDLIKHIQTRGHLQFKHSNLWDRLSLFQTHFILFHTLYKLRDELFNQHSGILDINPLCIVLKPFEQSDMRELQHHDPLREYYLDINQLFTTTDKEVAELIAGFWIRLQGNEQRQRALAILELEDPVDFAAIKKQHRRLAMQHHPDRGGDKLRLQEINIAMQVLESAYRKVKSSH